MFKTKFLFRLDDSCPTMDCTKWGRIEKIFDSYGVKPMVGVIPHNEDPKQRIDSEDENFWLKVHAWEEKGWAIAMHGYNHVYTSKDGGMNPLWKKSEFAGHPIEVQREKVAKGVAIMREHGLNPMYFFAPSHTFDKNTLIVLKEETDIRIISDTIASRPYRFGDFVFIPQQSGHPIKLLLGGYVTVCIHPNTMDENAFINLDAFLKCVDKNMVLSFDDIDTRNVKEKSINDRLLSYLYFLRRKLCRKEEYNKLLL